MKEKHFYFAGALLALVAMAVNHAVADDAPRGWSNSLSFSSPSQQSVDFNQAQQELLARNGLLGNRTYVTNNDHSTSNSTTNCQVAGSCQNGGTATNINGYSSIQVENSDNVTVGVDIDAESNQDATSAPIVAEDIGTIDFN